MAKIVRIPDPGSCRCPEPRVDLLETPPPWHETTYTMHIHILLYAHSMQVSISSYTSGSSIYNIYSYLSVAWTVFWRCNHRVDMNPVCTWWGVQDDIVPLMSYCYCVMGPLNQTLQKSYKAFKHETTSNTLNHKMVVSFYNHSF